MTQDPFQVETRDNYGEDFDYCFFGTDYDGKDYRIILEYPKAEHMGIISEGARANCELVAKLLNAYYGYIIDTGKIRDYAMGLGIPGDDQSDLFKAATAVREGE